MKAIIVPMTKQEKLQQIEEELESARYRDFLRLQRSREARESVRINGVRYISKRQTKIYVKRITERQELKQLEYDLEWDRYLEHLQKSGK